MILAFCSIGTNALFAQKNLQISKATKWYPQAEVVSTATPIKTSTSDVRAIGGTTRITSGLGGFPVLACWMRWIFKKATAANKVVAPSILR